MLKLKYSARINLVIIQVYAPIEDAEEEEEEKNQFYEALSETMIKEREYYTIIMGDFNSKIGTPSTTNNCVG